jgi:hypothetical protein
MRLRAKKCAPPRENRFFLWSFDNESPLRSRRSPSHSHNMSLIIHPSMHGGPRRDDDDVVLECTDPRRCKTHVCGGGDPVHVLRAFSTKRAASSAVIAGVCKLRCAGKDLFQDAPDRMTWVVHILQDSPRGEKPRFSSVWPQSSPMDCWPAGLSHIMDDAVSNAPMCPIVLLLKTSGKQTIYHSLFFYAATREVS